MNVIETKLAGVLILEPRVFRDARGWFSEVWHTSRYGEVGLRAEFVQDNVSFSRRGVLRGLHYQYPSEQAKLVSVLQGHVYDVAVDIRRGSPTFGHWVGVDLTAESLNQLYIPAGFAHGFVVLSETACVTYKCTHVYARDHEWGVRWDDPDIGIEWPVSDPLLSEKDREAPTLAALPDRALPSYGG